MVKEPTILVRPSRPGERWPGHPEELWFAWMDGEAAGSLGDTPERAVNKVIASHPELELPYTVKLVDGTLSDVMKRAAQNRVVMEAYNSGPPYTEEQLRQ